MKKLLAILLTLVMVVSLFAACGTPATETTEPTEDPMTDPAPAPIEITFWSFPVGGFGDAETVEGFIASFNEMYPEITVKHETLDYGTGDDQVTAAIEAGTAPDIIMEGPERLVANWGAKGLMVDLSDLLDDEAKADISTVSASVIADCTAPNGEVYEYPMVMVTHCMGINYEVFEQAGALQYIDEENRSWTTDDFVMAMEAVRDSGLVQTPGIIYSGGQGGDQGTRALVKNLYGAQFTDADKTMYTITDDLGMQGFELLVDMVDNGSLSHDAGIAAAEELQLFANGTSATTLAWNASNEANYAEQAAFTPFAMNFPSDDGVAELDGGIWGFGIFDNGDQAKIDAAKMFIEFIADDAEQGPISVAATGFFPVRGSYGNVYAGTDREDRMEIYASFLPNFGSYYQASPGWAEQRTAWWNMLQQIFGGEDIQTAFDTYDAAVDAAING